MLDSPGHLRSTVYPSVAHHRDMCTVLIDASHEGDIKCPEVAIRGVKIHGITRLDIGYILRDGPIFSVAGISATRWCLFRAVVRSSTAIEAVVYGSHEPTGYTYSSGRATTVNGEFIDHPMRPARRSLHTPRQSANCIGVWAPAKDGYNQMIHSTLTGITFSRTHTDRERSYRDHRGASP